MRMPIVDDSSYADTINMDRLRAIFTGRSGTKDTRDANPDEYEPLRTSGDHVVEAVDGTEGDDDAVVAVEVPFSWLEYTIFALVGVAMLWAW